MRLRSAGSRVRRPVLDGAEPLRRRGARKRRDTASASLRQQAVSRHGRRPAVLLARRHGLGAVSPAQSRGSRSATSRNRAKRRFTVDPGRRPRRARRPERPQRVRPPAAREQRPGDPDVKDGPNNDYWDHVDFIVSRPTRSGSTSASCRPGATSGTSSAAPGRRCSRRQNAEVYGAWLGRRYKDTPDIIWILGGDRAIETDTQKEIIRAMARGLRTGDGGTHLMTLHPTGGQGSAAAFHDDDVARLQHAAERPRRRSSPAATTRPGSTTTGRPIKPVVDGEPIYEDHPVSFNADEPRPFDRRRRAASALLGSVQRRVRPHLRPSLGLADVGARPHSRSTTR